MQNEVGNETLKTEKTSEADHQNRASEQCGVEQQRVARPRRKAASVGLMGMIAATAAIAGPLMSLPSRREEKREQTDTDRWYLKRAEERRARRLQKRQENQRQIWPTLRAAIENAREAAWWLSVDDYESALEELREARTKLNKALAPNRRRRPFGANGKLTHSRD